MQGVWPTQEPRAGPAEEGDATQRVQDQEPGDREADQGEHPEEEAGGGGQPEEEPAEDLHLRQEQGEVQRQVRQGQVDEHREEDNQGMGFSLQRGIITFVLPTHPD